MIQTCFRTLVQLRTFGFVLILTLLNSTLALQARASAIPEENVFLCIYADHLEPAANEWVAYREQMGWQAEAIAISKITLPGNQRGTFEFPAAWLLEDSPLRGNQAARHLLSYLQARFAEAQHASGIKGGYFAVLLLGDVNTPKNHAADRAVIPTFRFNKPDDWTLHSFAERSNYATDHPYQFADFADQLPDFTLGRVPAQTNAEALTVLNRIKQYERDPAPGAWRKRINYVASEGRFGLVDKLIESLFIKMVETVVPYDFDITMTYANPNSPYCAPPSQFNDYVMRRFNEGALLVNYIGHGASNQLDVLNWRGRYYPICEQAQIAGELEIDPTRAPILLIVACTTGMYDLPGGQPALSEALLFHPRGPIAVVSGSRITHPYPNAIFQSTFTKELCQHQRPTIGGVNLMATRRLIKLQDEGNQQFETLANFMALQQGWKTSPAALRNYHAALYNLLGDPATTIPYPNTDSFADLSFDQATGSGSGRIENPRKPGSMQIVVTIETVRSTIAHPADLQQVSGRDDPDLETKAAHNYEIANNFVLATLQTNLDAQGNFHFIFADWNSLPLPSGTTQLWLKLAAYQNSADAEGLPPRAAVDAGYLEALGALQINLPDN